MQNCGLRSADDLKIRRAGACPPAEGSLSLRGAKRRGNPFSLLALPAPGGRQLPSRGAMGCCAVRKAFPLRGRWPPEGRSDEVCLQYDYETALTDAPHPTPHQSALRLTASPQGEAFLGAAHIRSACLHAELLQSRRKNAILLN